MAPTPRFQRALELFTAAHSTDPTTDASGAPESLSYHTTLAANVAKLSQLSSDPTLRAGPSEALLLAAHSQHIRRWERPRSDYPEGLSAYKSWRTGLNKFHADVAHEIMTEAGYEPAEDVELYARVRDLLLKRTLARPLLPSPLKDPEVHLFEDAICLTFLELQFVAFNTKVSDESKMLVIVRKTWEKMTADGQGVVVRELLGGLPEDLQQVVGKALA